MHQAVRSRRYRSRFETVFGELVSAIVEIVKALVDGTVAKERALHFYYVN